MSVVGLTETFNLISKVLNHLHSRVSDFLVVLTCFYDCLQVLLFVIYFLNLRYFPFKLPKFLLLFNFFYCATFFS